MNPVPVCSQVAVGCYIARKTKKVGVFQSITLEPILCNNTTMMRNYGKWIGFQTYGTKKYKYEDLPSTNLT